MPIRQSELPRRSGGIRDLVGRMNTDIQQHEMKEKLNPFSRAFDPNFASANLPSRTDAENYGKPIQGSKTDLRGREAEKHVQREVGFLLDILNSKGTTDPSNNLKYITFGELFKIYSRISDKLVGILLRARKHGLVAFQGEMLYQRRDEHEPIYLLFYGSENDLNEICSINSRESVVKSPSTSKLLEEAKIHKLVEKKNYESMHSQSTADFKLLDEGKSPCTSNTQSTITDMPKNKDKL